MVRVIQIRERQDLTPQAFENAEFFRFDLCQPGDSVIIPSNYATREQMDGSIDETVRQMKLAREGIVLLGAKGLLSTDMVCSTIETARVVVDAINLSMHRYYHGREEGLRIKQQWEYAAVSSTGITKFFKNAIITVRYGMEARSKYYSIKRYKRARELEDGLDKLIKYSQEALFVSAGNEPHW